MSENDEIRAEVKTLSFNLESYKKENDKCNDDLQAHLNDLSERYKEINDDVSESKGDIKIIKDNHLAHLKADIKWLKWTVGIGLAFIALLNGILGAIIAYSVVFNG